MIMKKITLLLLLLSTFANAGTIDPNVPDSKYVEYGKKYECVLPIAGIYADKLNSQFKASCVVIDEYYVLTAAHVVEGSITQHVIYKNEVYPCRVMVIPIEFKKDVKVGRSDIALAKLQRPLKLDFYPELYSADDEVGKVCGIAGYGFSGTFKTGANRPFDNIKRAGSNIIDKIEDDFLICSTGKGTKTTLEFMIAPGDSGGGLFIDQKLAGINSRVFSTDGSANSDYGDEGVFTRISVYYEWIQNIKKLTKDL